MINTFLFRTDALFLCILLFVACVLMVLLGRFIRSKFFHKDAQETKGGVNAVIGALFGLWGFVLAFTFGTSAARFENIRSLMIEEGNSIRTAIIWSRAFPDSIGNELRKDLRTYLEIRIATSKNLTGVEMLSNERQRSEDIGKGLWLKLAQLANLPSVGGRATAMMSSLATMFDLSARRDGVLLAGVPDLIIWMLFFLALIVSFVGGFTTPVIGSKEWVIIVAFILFATTLIYITMDLGRPLRGFIKPEVGEERLTRLRGLF